MFAVKINKGNFEYDVNSLVKAFFPEETVKVLTPETGEAKRSVLEGEIRLEIELTEEGAKLVRFLRKDDSSEGGGGNFGQIPGSGENPQQFPCSGESVRQSSCPGEPEVLVWHYDPETEKGDTYKNGFKRFLYRSLAQMTGKELPWGALTGIRPTKIAYGLLEEGGSDEEILQFYRKKYYASREKAELSIRIAGRERELLASLGHEPLSGYSLYIGIPFCPTTCMYCSFTSFAIGAYRSRVEEYLDCLLREMDDVAGQMGNRILDSVYIGGGTPTTLEPEQLERLIGHLEGCFDLSHLKEFTVEAGRADSITREKLEVLRRHKVTRISINPQTMKQETLDVIGRRATVEQVEEAFRLARSLGFDNINMDIILGLPGEGAPDVRHTIDRILELGPDSLTVHSLAVKRASRLSQWVEEHGVSTINNTDETMAIAAEGARKLGMEPYYLYRQKNMSGNFENVGYARPGKFGLYNILIMEEVQTIVACGAGSITKKVSLRRAEDGSESAFIERCENVKEVAQYIERIDEMIERKRRLLTDAG